MVTSDDDDIHAELIRIEGEIRRLMDDLARLRARALESEIEVPTEPPPRFSRMDMEAPPSTRR